MTGPAGLLRIRRRLLLACACMYSRLRLDTYINMQISRRLAYIVQFKTYIITYIQQLARTRTQPLVQRTAAVPYLHA